MEKAQSPVAPRFDVAATLRRYGLGDDQIGNVVTRLRQRGKITVFEILDDEGIHFPDMDTMDPVIQQGLFVEDVFASLKGRRPWVVVGVQKQPSGIPVCSPHPTTRRTIPSCGDHRCSPNQSHPARR